MNRVVKTTINGTEYSLNYSMRALREIMDRFGTSTAFFEQIEESNNLIWTLHLLLEQGAEYQKIMYGKESKIYTVDELEVILTPVEMGRIEEDIIRALQVGTQREKEVAEKNAETAQETEPVSAGS